METIVSGAEFDTDAAPVIIGFAEFDALAPAEAASPVIISWVEFDTLAPSASPTVICSLIEFDSLGTGGAASIDNIGARRSARTSVSTVKSSPPAPVSTYHSRAYEQEEAERAAELADEEAVLTFLMELSLV